MRDVYLISIIFTIVCTVNAVPQTFEGYRLYKVLPKNRDEVKILEDIQLNRIGNLWNEQLGVDFDTRIMVAQDKIDEFHEHLGRYNIKANEIIGDVQQAINSQLKRSPIRSSESFHNFTWTEYHNLDEIYAWLDELALNYPNIVTTVNIGMSVENREIKGIIINYQPNKSNPLIGMLEGTLHAREWISPATVTWIVKEFLTSTDPVVRNLAENLEWHVFPVVNPDGYVYTFTHNRMWRKNRSPESVTTCASTGVDDDLSHGVDLNRNFGYEWMTVGASSNPCSNTFAGPIPFSEPESRAIAQYVLGLNQRGELIYYLAFHSYTQLIVIPYSHVETEEALLSGNYADMYEIAIRGAEALNRRYGTEYRVGLSADVLYPMSGASFDWVKYSTNVPVSYLIELRDVGEFGFLLPPQQIIPNSLEVMDAIIEMDRTTRSLGYYSSAADNIVYSATIIIIGVLFIMLQD